MAGGRSSQSFLPDIIRLNAGPCEWKGAPDSGGPKKYCETNADDGSPLLLVLLEADAESMRLLSSGLAFKKRATMKSTLASLLLKGKLEDFLGGLAFGDGKRYIGAVLL